MEEVRGVLLPVLEARLRMQAENLAAFCHPKVCCSVFSVLQCVAVCCSVLQRVAACCSVLQRVAACCRVLPCVTVCCRVF